MANTAPDILRDGLRILEERAKEYEQPGGERSTAKIVAAFNAITGREGDRGINETEGWLFLRLLKDVRFFSTVSFHRDSGVDGVNYTALMVESKAREQVPPPPPPPPAGRVVRDGFSPPPPYDNGGVVKKGI